MKNVDISNSEFIILELTMPKLFFEIELIVVTNGSFQLESLFLIFISIHGRTLTLILLSKTLIL